MLVVFGLLMMLSTLTLVMVSTSLEFELGVLKGSWYDDDSICKCLAEIGFCTSFLFCQNYSIPPLKSKQFTILPWYST